MKNIFTLCLFLIIELTASISFAQKKIAILGSSTAAGYGASDISFSWVGRLQASFRKNTADGIDTVIDNRAQAGYVTYKSLPSDYPVPAGRPSPDPLRNVTYVLNDNPRADVVIINYPTNDIVSDYNPKEMMDNLRLMFEQFNANGIRCYISTSQPRNINTSDAQRTILRKLVDSIINNFGNYGINFWDDLVTNDGQNRLRPEVDADGIHPNDLGHQLLFQRVQAKNIFSTGSPLPVILKDWQASPENSSVKIKWSTAQEEPNTLFELQRSANAKDFQTLFQINGTGQNADYSWTDASPLSGKNFYRLKISEPGKITYSRIIPVVNDKKQLLINMYADASLLHLQLNGNSNQTAVLAIINYSGATVKKQTLTLTGFNITITIPISELPSGEYFLQITTAGGVTATERFARMK